MTGIVWGMALGLRVNSWRFAAQMGAAATGVVLLGPLIIVIVTHAPDAFTPLVLGANALFWAYVFWTVRDKRTPA